MGTSHGITESTIARIAGNVASGLAGTLMQMTVGHSNSVDLLRSIEGESERIAKTSVAIARAIAAEVQRTTEIIDKHHVAAAINQTICQKCDESWREYRLAGGPEHQGCVPLLKLRDALGLSDIPRERTTPREDLSRAPEWLKHCNCGFGNYSDPLTHAWDCSGFSKWLRSIPSGKRFDALHPDGVCRHEGTKHTPYGSVDCPVLRNLWQEG